MTAFGPYKDTETIYFNELDQHHLFVISGKTGAGKTTIFDGICFALYGSASGTDRDSYTMLRSDFASDDIHTAVELEFELRGRHYRILRQLGHMKKGNKTKTGDRYEFYEFVNGKEVPCVDRQIVSEIDKQVESTIGLTQDQFKQIVMLPQGEFRKLLTSQTENKEAILRRIFKTESYKQLNELLKQKKDHVFQQVEKSKAKRDNYIQSLESVLPKREDSILFQVLEAEYYNINQVIEGLDQEVAYYQDQIEKDEKTYNDAYKAHDKKQTEFHEAKAINDRFQELDAKERQLNHLQEQIPAITQDEKRLEAAERASNLEIYEKQVQEWKKEENEKIAVLKQAKRANEKAEQQLKNAMHVYQEEERKQGERDGIRKQVERLNDYLPVVEEINNRKLELDALKEKKTTVYDDLEKVKSLIQGRKDEIEVRQANISEMDKAVSELPQKQKSLAEMREKARILKSYFDVEEPHSTLKKDLQEKENAYKKLKNKYDEIEQKWLNNQASHLAVHLHDGNPCPVCGSMDHPNKATNTDELVTREQLQAVKKELEAVENQYRDVYLNYKSNLTQLSEKETALKDYHIQPGEAVEVNKQLVEKGKKCNEEVTSLEKLQKELQQAKEKQDKENEALKQQELKKEKLEKNYQEYRTSFETRKAVYEEQLRHIPEELRELEKLKEQITVISRKKIELEQAWERAQTTLQQEKEEQTKAASNLTHAQKQVKETTEKREEAVSQFHKALEKADFETVETYQQAKLPESERESLKTTIQQFKEKLSITKQQVSELKEALKDKKRVDLTEVQSLLAQLKQAYEQALNELHLSKEYYEEATKLKANIIETHEQVVQKEKQFATISDLYDVMRGQNNQKISFERYLQIEYLERIIEAANGRLKRLSNGQFYLQRSDRQESHGKQSGLGLDVYDAYTGQTRDVKTLSGGEKFNASLCLALGMSDVIQRFQGNISIDTMFIDEGFGSLDEESLNKSIDTLIDLQKSGRMIGVISHVQELKSMFPAILEVSKTKEGFSQTKFVLK